MSRAQTISPGWRALALLITALPLLHAPATAFGQERADVVAEDIGNTSDSSEADARAEARLNAIFGAVDAFSDVRVEVRIGVAHLTGNVGTSEDRDQAIALARGMDGVVYVDESLSEPVAVVDRLAPLRERAESWLATALERLPMFLIALLAFVGFTALGRWIARRKRWIARLVKRPIYREVVGRVVSLLFTAAGLLLALELLDATTLVGTVLGAAGVLGIAMGFAFRDIVENYLASFLLASRRPFSPGDAIKVDDFEGKVVRLTMRETVLMTFDGNHVSLPNASVFKTPILNYTRNPKRRFEFVVGAGVDTDLREARASGVDTLNKTRGVVSDPEPYSVIEALGDSNVAIRFFGWVDQREADFLKVRSEAIRRVKTSLEDAGVDMPEPIYRVHLSSAGEAAAPAKERKASSTTRLVDDGHEEVDLRPDDAIDRQIAENHSPDDDDLLAA